MTELSYGPYHSPTLGDRVRGSVDVISAAANGELGFDDVTVQTAPPPTPVETAEFPVSCSLQFHSQPMTFYL